MCTIYPREYYFTVMVIVGTKEKASVEEILPECTVELQTIYNQVQEGKSWEKETGQSELAEVI